MTKHFCDSCGAEIKRNAVSHRYRPERVLPNGTRIQCDIMVSVNGVSNSGDLCVPCVLAAILQGLEKEAPKLEINPSASGKVNSSDFPPEGWKITWGGDASFADCVER